MARFVRTTTVRKFNVRDNRKHFGAVVRTVAALPMASLRLRSIARILLAWLDERAGTGQPGVKGLDCHPIAAGLSGRLALASSQRAPMWLYPKPCPATLSAF